MRVQDFIADETNRAMEGLLRQVRRVPADKADWSPLGEGRSALDQLQECAVIAGFYPHLLATFEPPVFDEASMAAFEEARKKLDTVEKAEAALREGTAKTIAAIQAVPDEKLEDTMTFFGPEPWKISSVMLAHYWNMTWHTGQTCFIQTLLGDKKMG